MGAPPKKFAPGPGGTPGAAPSPGPQAPARPALTLAASAPGPGDRGLHEMMSEIDRLRGEAERLRGRIRELESLADTDPLLPIFNRRAFMRELSRAVSLAERYEEPLAVALFDLNGFKAVNDTFGHAAGDAVLSHVADLLFAHVRDSDIVGRLGGDEFGVILLRSELTAARTKARDLADLIRSTPAPAGSRSHSVGAAWGVAQHRAGETAAALMARADEAMYADKPARREPAGEQPSAPQPR